MDSPIARGGLPPPPVPIARTYSRETSPEVIEIRKMKTEAARNGSLCPVNQHGCFYIGGDPDAVCEMCLWKAGNDKGFSDGLLAYRGETLEKHNVSLKTSDYIKINKEELSSIFGEMKMFNNAEMGPYEWTVICFDGKLPCDYYELPHKNLHPMHLNVFTRAQLHNHLMVYGALNELTDEKWESFKKRWPN
jgi:hypothetical protein